MLPVCQFLCYILFASQNIYYCSLINIIVGKIQKTTICLYLFESYDLHAGDQVVIDEFKNNRLFHVVMSVLCTKLVF